MLKVKLPQLELGIAQFPRSSVLKTPVIGLTDVLQP
jgi:hypothetical protein